MIGIFLDKLVYLGINEVVCSADLYLALKSECEDRKINLKMIIDARSAAFWVIGRVKVCEKPVALVLQQSYISNAYTAITEAFYQKIPVLIVSVGQPMSQKVASYMKFCVYKILDIWNIQDIELLEYNNLFKVSKPILLNLNCSVETYCDSVGQLSTVLTHLNGKMNPMNLVVCYGDNVSKENEYLFDIKYIPLRYGYGAISKYLGMLQNTNRTIVLVLPVELFILDFNIFNSRYTSPNLKICVYDIKSIDDLKTRWLEDNKIKLICATDNCENIDTFIKAQTPVVYIMQQRRNDHVYIS